MIKFNLWIQSELYDNPKQDWSLIQKAINWQMDTKWITHILQKLFLVPYKLWELISGLEAAYLLFPFLFSYYTT